MYKLCTVLARMFIIREAHLQNQRGCAVSSRYIFNFSQDVPCEGGTSFVSARTYSISQAHLQHNYKRECSVLVRKINNNGTSLILYILAHAEDLPYSVCQKPWEMVSQTLVTRKSPCHSDFECLNISFIKNELDDIDLNSKGHSKKWRKNYMAFSRLYSMSIHFRHTLVSKEPQEDQCIPSRPNSF